MFPPPVPGLLWNGCTRRLLRSLVEQCGRLDPVERVARGDIAARRDEPASRFLTSWQAIQLGQGEVDLTRLQPLLGACQPLAGQRRRTVAATDGDETAKLLPQRGPPALRR